MKKLVLVALVAACSKKAPPEPFKGPLTVDRIMAAKDAVKPFQPWPDAFAVLQSKLGAPTKVDGTKYKWAAMSGDDCAYMIVEQDDGKQFHKDGPMVGMVQEPGKYGPHDAMMNRDDCLEILGKDVAPEDPNAAGPADTNQVKDVVSNAVNGRSKWKGKQIKVAAKVKQTGSLVVLADTSDDAQEIHAEMKDGVTPPEQDKVVTLTCTVKIDKWMSGNGTKLEASLEQCTL
ncbi:MAG: hypothetical protein JO257_02545 [Deltaproteobacteria bacterium]|nr:hypothetical protein [Deltaproteobacteria bacterium]